MEKRIERDSMGEMEVPADALYGASTRRAELNFPISGLRFQRRFIKALGVIKYCAAGINEKLNLLEGDKAKAIQQAAREVVDGKFDAEFVLDIFQTGSGTSTNMNANEVIANRAIEILGGKKGDRSVVHPNDDVNMGQSSNDVIPTAIHISSVEAVCEDLIPSLKNLHQALQKKAKAFDNVLKSGRTHLQDATPIRLGQEFSGYATQIEKGIGRIESSLKNLYELALGGTAVGTGLNAPDGFASQVIADIAKMSELSFVEAENHFEAQGSRDAIVELSGQLRTVACSLMKIANDIRWLASGPRCGLGELQLPEIQPGSSIMPGKVNPVICESVLMVGAQVIGNDATIGVVGQHGNFELNVMLPVCAYNILQSIEILSTSSQNFVDRCIDGLEADTEKCLEYAENSLAVCTALAPHIGYDKAAAISKKAYKEGKTIREVATSESGLSEQELKGLLDLMKMT